MGNHNESPTKHPGHIEIQPSQPNETQVLTPDQTELFLETNSIYHMELCPQRVIPTPHRFTTDTTNQL